MSRLRLFPLSCAHYIMNFVHDRHSPLPMNKLRLFPLANAHYIMIFISAKESLFPAVSDNPECPFL